MPRKQWVLGLVLALLPGLASAAAKNGATVSLGVHDFNIPTVRTLFDQGYQGSVEYQRFLQDNAALGLEADYMTAAGVNPKDLMTWYSFALTGTYLLSPDKPLQPYFKLGLGYAFTNTNFLGEVNVPNSGYLYELAMGADYVFKNQLTLNLQLAYERCLMDNAFEIDDLDLGGMITTVGVGYRF